MANASVLLVDQDEHVRFDVKKLLERLAFPVVGEAWFGTDAVNRAIELNPDVILCALEEPLVRPLETIAALRSALPHTPVIVYSSRGDLQMARKAMLAGARDYLVHPLRPLDLQAALSSVSSSGEHLSADSTGRELWIGPVGTVIAVFAAKGGVGKTTIATNVGASLAADIGQSVVLLDADTTFGDVMIALNLDAPPSAGMAPFIHELQTGGAGDIAHHLVSHKSGVRVLPPPENPLDWVNYSPEQFVEIVDLAARRHDFVIVDLSPSLNPITTAVLDIASIVLWVMSPELAAIRASRAALEVLTEHEMPMEKIRMVLNHPHAKAEVPGEGIERAVNSLIYWRVPHDRDLYARGQLGVTIAEQGKLGPGGKSIADLAATLAGRSHRPPARSGLRAALALGAKK